MKIVQKIVYILLITLSSLGAESLDVTLNKGWNQITVPLDHIKIDLLVADENIDVIWAYQNAKYRLATQNKEYIKLADHNFETGILRSLSFGESIYVLAKEETTLTFVGQKNFNPPVRSEFLSSVWTQMSRKDFKDSKWNLISKITEGQQIIASKIVMKDNRPSLKVYSNVASEVAKINPEFYEDFEVGENDSFWIKDAANVEDIENFNFALINTPSKGGEAIDFTIDASSSDKNRRFLSVKIVAFKDGDVNNQEHILFDDYVKLNFAEQSLSSVLPMLLESDFGSYRVYAIKDLAAQFDKVGIDLFNLLDTNAEDVKEAYKNILASSEYKDITLSTNSSEVVYRMKLESREYANSVLYYNPLKELNRLAQNQSKDLSEFSYKDIGKHTEFQLNIQAFGHSGLAVKETKIKAYLKVASTLREVIILSDKSRLEETYTIDNMKISLPDELHGGDLTLALMMYGVDALKDSSDLTLYEDVLVELKSGKKTCLDTECSQWFFKKEFDLDIAVSADREPTSNDVIGKTTVTLYSDVFDNNTVTNYESKDTVVSLTNILLREDTYNNEIDKRRVGIIGNESGTEQLIVDLQHLKSDLDAQTADNLIFDPLTTYETEIVELMIYKKDEEGNIDITQTNDATLQVKWESYVEVADVANHLCNRKNYFTKTVPYTKKVTNPNGGDDVDIITATQDLCLYNIDYEYINSLSPSDIETIAVLFKEFVVVKQSKSEDERLSDFWNPLFALDNSTLHMPEFYGKEMPIVKKRMGGGVTFSSKLALDSELNELRTNAYVDVDVELVKEFKLLDLDFETVVSGSDPEASRFDFHLYSIKPDAEEDLFTLKKIFTFHQQIQTTYENSKKIDLTFVKGKEIHFQAGPVPIFFAFEMGLYAFFEVGVNLDVSDHLLVYAIPGARIFGTLAGGLGIDVVALQLDVGIILEDFTVIRASVPTVAVLDEFKLDKSGFASVFKLYSNLEMRVAEITVSIFAEIKAAKQAIVNLQVDLFSYKGFDPLKALGLKSDDGSGKYPTDCQDAYNGVELFCVRKELKLEFTFSGLTTSECSILDTEYKRRTDVDGDITYLYSTNEFRKVRGCVNDKYEFENVSIDDWDLSESQWDDVNNLNFWKWDSRALISQEVEEEEEIDPYQTPWADAWQTSDDENSDDVHERWKTLTGYEW